MSSDVSVEYRQTIVMGGLVRNERVNSESGIPILKDIPWIGKWLFGQVEQRERRSELLVFITPYVLDDAESAQAEALRRKKSISDPRPWEDNGWSLSPLADPVSKKEQLRRLNDEWERQDSERRTKRAIEQAKVERVKKLKDMTEKEREYWIKLHEKELEEESKKTESDQAELRLLVEDIKAKKLGEAETAIEGARTEEKNEYRKMVDEKAKEEKPQLPPGETLRKDVEAAKAAKPEPVANPAPVAKPEGGQPPAPVQKPAPADKPAPAK